MAQRITLGEDVKNVATSNLVWKIVEATFGNAEQQLKKRLAGKMMDWNQTRLMGLKQMIDEHDESRARRLMTSWL